MTATVTIREEDTTSTRPRRRLAVIVALVALAVMVAGLLMWRSAVTDADAAMAADRDAALIDARRHIETLNTMDTGSPKAGLDAWQAATTGTLRDQLVQLNEDEVNWLGEQGTVSVGKVIDAGILSLDGDSATVLAAVEVTVTDPKKTGSDDEGAEPSVKRNRFAADLVQVKGEWLLESLEPVQVGVDGALQ